MRQRRIVTTSAVVVALLMAVSGCASGISMPDIDISDMKLPTVTVRETVTALPSYPLQDGDSDGASVPPSTTSQSVGPTGPFTTALGPSDFDDVDSEPLDSMPLGKHMTNPTTVTVARTTMTVTQTVTAAPASTVSSAATGSAVSDMTQPVS